MKSLTNSAPRRPQGFFPYEPPRGWRDRCVSCKQHIRTGLPVHFIFGVTARDMSLECYTCWRLSTT